MNTPTVPAHTPAHASAHAPTPAPHVLYAHFTTLTRTPLPEERYPALLTLLADITPTVQALPPDAALADVSGSLRYFHRTATDLAALLRARALAHHGVDATVGVASSVLLARIAAYDGPPGAVRTAPTAPDAVAAYLARRPVATLPGIGPATARALCHYGLDSVGRLAAAPPTTLQRILGAPAARRVRDLARGIDPTPVTPSAPARTASAEYRFDHDELAPDQQRRALLHLTDELGLRLRTAHQVTRALTLTVRYADRSTTTRTRALPEPTAHTPALTTTAYALHQSLALQRARVRSLALRAEDLTASADAAHQLTFDRAATNTHALEPVLDRARARWPDSIRPATLAAAP